MAQGDSADAATRERPAATSLLNSTPATPAPEAAAAAPGGEPAQTAATTVKGVPPDLLPIYAAAAKRTGIPVDVLIAQAKQESNFRNDIIGNAGEIGLHQILPSTARNPGFGMSGIDPATLKDPAVGINFAADYLRARAGQDADFSNPKVIDAALRAYNGMGQGGDPNYVANVRRYMPPAQQPLGGLRGQYAFNDTGILNGAVVPPPVRPPLSQLPSPAQEAPTGYTLTPYGLVPTASWDRYMAGRTG
jgi:soluble lytic murein transglycosylase-like protein